MSEDEKLVHAVAQAVLSSRRSSGVERPGQVAAETIRMAMAAIAAVRAWDAEQGLVTVPLLDLGKLDETLFATPAPQSDGEA